MKFKRSLFLCILTLTVGCQSGKQPLFPSGGSWIDLSYSYDSKTPYWPTSDGFKLDTLFAGMAAGGYFYSSFTFSSAEHGGTHIDAPVHFAAGKQSVDQIPLSSLTGQALVVDVTDSVDQYIDYQIAQADFERWERAHGKIPDDAIILLRTGFGKYWPDKKKYLGTDQLGETAIPLLHFPGLHPDAAKWLVQQRKIKAIGLDTPSIDYGRSSQFMSHRILFEADIPAFENLANLDKLPATGIYIVALPMKIKGGSGGPLRIAAYLPQKLPE